MNEIRKLALSYIQDYAAEYGVYLIQPLSRDLYKIVDTSEQIASHIVYAIDCNDYQFLKTYLNISESYLDLKDDLYQLAVKISNLV